MLKIPYSSINELPASVKKYSVKIQTIWMNAFNVAYKQYKGNETISFKVANSAIKKYRESNSYIPEEQFDDDINRFLKDEKREVERKDDSYGEDLHNQLDEFLKS